MQRMRLEMGDPTFAPGSTHVAHVQVENPTDRTITYQMHLYLEAEGYTPAVKTVAAHLYQGENTVVWPGPTMSVADAAQYLAGGIVIWYKFYHETDFRWYADPLVGDLNDDGRLNSTDVSILERYMLGYTVQQLRDDGVTPLSDQEFLYRADVNRDGLINSTDVSMIERLMLYPELTQLVEGETYTIHATQEQDWVIPGEEEPGWDEFTLGPGESDTRNIQIVTPSQEGTYSVLLDVYVGGELIRAYQADEDVVITVGQPDFRLTMFGVITEYHWEDVHTAVKHLCRVKNVGSAEGTRWVQLWGDGAMQQEESVTLAPGQETLLEWLYGMVRVGSSGTSWVLTEWGEESAHLTSTAGEPQSMPTDIVISDVTVSGTRARFHAQFDADPVEGKLREGSDEYHVILPEASSLNETTYGWFELLNLHTGSRYTVRFESRTEYDYERFYT